MSEQTWHWPWQHDWEYTGDPPKVIPADPSCSGLVGWKYRCRGCGKTKWGGEPREGTDK